METTERANRVPDGKIILPDNESVREAIEEYKQLLSWAKGSAKSNSTFSVTVAGITIQLKAILSAPPLMPDSAKNRSGNCSED